MTVADLLSHVLLAYVLFTLASWRIRWLTPRWVVVGMGGACIPDLTRVSLVVESHTVERALGVPFTFGHLSTVGGVLIVAGIVAVLFERERWRRVYGLLVVGGTSHLVVDGLRVWADGRASQWLFPLLPSWRPPTPGLYVTSDPTILVLVTAVAVAVFALDRYLRSGDEATASAS